MTWEWAAAGAVFLLVVVFSVRLMKRGLFTLEDERAQCEERIRLMEEELRQDQKNMPSSEHLRIALAGLRDLLRLAGYPGGFWIEVTARGQGEAGGEALLLHTPGGDWRISLSMRERQLRAVRKVAHGQGRWHLYGPGIHEEYTELAPLMCALHTHLRQRDGSAGTGFNTPGTLAVPTAFTARDKNGAESRLADAPPEKPHLARRFSRRAARAGIRKKSLPPPLKPGSH